MIRNYLCKNTKCNHHFTYNSPTTGKTFFKNGKWYDYNTKIEIVKEIIVCPLCASEAESVCLETAPMTKFPIHDLTYSSSKKRIIDGLYHDASSVTKKRANALRDEMTQSSTKRLS